MNSRLQIVLAGIVLIGLALFLGPMLIDWNRYKPETEAWLSRETGHKVVIAGDLSVRLLPQPRFTMKAVTVAGTPPAPDGTALMRAGTLDARIAILPLFIGRVVVTALKLDEPVLTLERRADGRLNLGRAEPRAPAHRIVPAGFSLAPHDVLVDKIEITRGTLLYRDAMLDWSETVTAVDAMALAVAENGSYRARAGFTWAGQPWTLSADAGALGKEGIRPLTLVLEHAAAGLRAQLSGRLDPGKAGLWRLAGSLKAQLASPSVFGAGAAAWGNPAQNSAAPPLTLEGVLAASPAAVSVHDTALRWGDFAARGGLEAGFTPEPKLVIHATGTRLNLDAVRPDLAAMSRVPYWPIAALQLFSAASAPPGNQPPPRGLGAIWQGSLDVKLDAVVFAQGRIERPSLTAAFAKGALDIGDLALVLPGDVELHVKGRAEGGAFDGEAALAGERARELFLWAGVPVQSVEEGRLAHIAYKGGLSIAPGSMRLTGFEAGLDGSVVKGLLALSRPAESGPQIEADLTVTRMNVDPYRALFASDKAPLDTLLAIADATSGPVKLAVETLVADGFEARGLAADLNLSAAGGMTIRSLKIDDLLGTELSLSGEAKALSGAASLALSGSAAALDLRPLLARLGVAAPRGEAALGPSTFDIKADIKQGSGAVTAEGYLAGGRSGVRLTLDKAEAPLAGRLGAGALALDAVVQSQNLLIAGRLAGYDPPIGKPGPASDISGPAYNAIPARDAQIPPGWVYLSLRRDPAGLALTGGAGLAGGKILLAFDRRGAAGSGSYDLALEGGAPDAQALLAGLGIPEAARKPVAGPFSLALKAKGPANAVALAPLQAVLGAMRIEGEGTLDVAQDKPVLTGTLRGTALDLDLLRALAPRIPQAEDVPGPWSEQRLDLSRLGAYGGHVAVEADSLAIGHLPFTAAKFVLELRDGVLNVSDLSANLFGGAMTANLALRGGAILPGLAASVKFVQIDGAALTKALWGKDFIAAPLNGALSLTAQGESTAAMAASAAGSLSLKSAGGTIAGLDRQAPAVPQSFTDLVLDIPVEAGVMTVKDGHMTAPAGAMTVGGHAALAPFTLSLAVTTEGKPGQIALEGPLDAPKRKVAP